MSKSRMINTKFWDDNYITKLDPIEKLLFLYFLTNTLTNISGIYEIQIKRVSFDTGIGGEIVDEILKRFEKEEKIYYIEGWIIIKNFIKHQNLNPNVKIGIKNEIEKIPNNIWLKIEKNDSLSKAIYSLSKETPSNLIKSNLIKSKSKSKSKSLQAEACGNDINSLIKLFKPINPNYKILFKNLSQRKALERMVKEHSFKKVKEMIIVLPEIICQKYAPQISTPVQLENKLGQLLIFVKQHKEEKGFIQV